MSVGLFVVLLATLAACGVDGPPTPPQAGETVSGEVSMGVTGVL